MANKILEKNGVDNTNIDGARFNRFCAGYRDGIIQGSFQEGVLTKINSNTLQLDRAELLISGFRVISDAVEFTFNSFPQNAERYQIVGQIRLDADKQPSFEYAVSRVREIVQNDLFSDNSGDNLYEVLIATFSLDSTGINDVLPILDVITGKSQSNMINVGNVTTEKIDINLPAEVDVDSRYDEETKKHYVDFEFHLPIDLTEIENNTNNALKNSQDAIEKANTATSGLSSAVDTANSAISVANDAKSDASNAISVAEKASTDANNAMTAVQEKVDKVEGKDLSSNDFTDDLLDKLNGIEAGAQVNPTKVSELENDSGFITVDDIPESGLTEEDLSGRILPESAVNSRFEPNANNPQLILGDNTSARTASALSSSGLYVSEARGNTTTYGAKIIDANFPTFYFRYSSKYIPLLEVPIRATGDTILTIGGTGIRFAGQIVICTEDSTDGTYKAGHIYKYVDGSTVVDITPETGVTEEDLAGRVVPTGATTTKFNDDGSLQVLGKTTVDDFGMLIGDSNSYVSFDEIGIELKNTNIFSMTSRTDEGTSFTYNFSAIPIKATGDSINDERKYTGQVVICTENSADGTYLAGHIYKYTDSGTIDITPSSTEGTQPEISSLSILHDSGQSLTSSNTYLGFTQMKGLIDDKEIEVSMQIPIMPAGVLYSTYSSHNGNPYWQIRASTDKTINADSTDSRLPTSKAVYTAIQGANSYTDTKVADLVGTAPETLDTLQEVAQAIQDNEDVVSALNSAIGTKANQSALDTTNTNVSNLTTRVTSIENGLGDQVTYTLEGTTLKITTK